MSKRSSALHQTLYRWHAWTGLFGGLFLLFLCVTGSVAVFRPEIERAADWGDFDFRTPGTAAGAPPLPLEEAMRRVQAADPGADVVGGAYAPPPGSAAAHGPAYRFTVRRPGGSLVLLVDPATADVLASGDPGRGWGNFVRQLHVRFLYGSFWGRWVAGFFGIVLVFSTVSGLIIYTRFNANSWKPMLRRGRGARIVSADLHKIVGFASLAFNLVFGVTGAVLGLEGIYYRYFGERDPAVTGPRVARLAPEVLGAALRRTGELLPGTTVTRFASAHARQGTFTVYAEHPAAALVRENASHVTFDTAGRVLEVYDAAAAPAAARAYYAMEPLHFGRLGGALWVKLLWAVMGLAGGFLSVSGFVIYAARKWKSRRPAPAAARAPAPPRPLRAAAGDDAAVAAFYSGDAS